MPKGGGARLATACKGGDASAALELIECNTDEKTEQLAMPTQCGPPSKHRVLTALWSDGIWRQRRVGDEHPEMTHLMLAVRRATRANYSGGAIPLTRALLWLDAAPFTRSQVVHDRQQVLRLLLASGVDVLVDAACGCDLKTALHVACSRGRVAVAKMLLDAPAPNAANPNAADALGRTPLLTSCLAHSGPCVEVLLAAGADVENPTANSRWVVLHNPGATPLYAAAFTGSLRCASLLLDAGAKVDARASNGKSPLLVACQEGHLEVAQLLSSHGAARDITFAWDVPVGSGAEALAEKGGHHELLQWLRRSPNWSALCHVEALTPSRTKALLRGGASPVERHGAASCRAPAASAAEIALEFPRSAAAQLILQAAAPWSPSTHELWGPRARARAAELVVFAYHFARRLGNHAFVDVFLFCVMPHAIDRSLDAKRDPSGCETTRYG